MKALLICPDCRPAVALLAEKVPLAVAPLLGRCLAEYWIEHLAGLGATEIAVAASDRVADIEEKVGDGTRWGLSISVTEEDGELSPEEALERCRCSSEAPPDLVVRMDHLPGLPGFPLLESYAAWFAGLLAWMPKAQAIDRIGQCEIQPGVWVGLRAHIDPSARLLAPCWIGNYVSVSRDAVIGPGAILEDGAVVGAGAVVAHSVVGPATFVGAQTRVEGSLAHRDTLIGWALGSCLRVPDAFWLCSLHELRPSRRQQTRSGPPKFNSEGCTLRVTNLDELSAESSSHFLREVHTALSSSIWTIEVDLSRTRYIDGCGLAALCSLHQSSGAVGVTLRLIDPESTVLQLLELTQTNRLFTIGRSDDPERGMPWSAPRWPSAVPGPRHMPADVPVLPVFRSPAGLELP
jgi:anti-anti-sigma factor